MSKVWNGLIHSPFDGKVICYFNKLMWPHKNAAYYNLSTKPTANSIAFISLKSSIIYLYFHNNVYPNVCTLTIIIIIGHYRAN